MDSLILFIIIVFIIFEIGLSIYRGYKTSQIIRSENKLIDSTREVIQAKNEDLLLDLSEE